MGLDMYLYKETYTKNSPFNEDSEKFYVNVTRGGYATKIRPERVAYVKEHIAYWRKFNALHGYIVENFGGGEDNCRDIHLSVEDIRSILDMLIEIRDANYSCAAELMPPVAGFFFGDDSINEFYIEEVERTIGILEDEINDIEDEEEPKTYVTFTYAASW